MIAEVFRYREITKSISSEIKNSPFKVEHIIKEMSMHPTTFYRKLRKNTFTSDEILKILFIIKPEEAHNYKFELLLKESLKDIEEGNFIDHEEMEKRIMRKYEN